uniref:RNase H type-1 domain-containing protein n=1 Tax=Lactuca sativa TaxID=4236 RepID=A0A9R1X3U0_LACSA|nr:hypothetical protein LSAT_V11C600301860 [Lactuca sativa]
MINPITPTHSFSASYPLQLPFQPYPFYGPSPGYHTPPSHGMNPQYQQGVSTVPGQESFSCSVTSPFVKELLDYEIPNTTKLPALKTYNGTTDPDSHIDTYEWTMTSLKLNEKFWCTYFLTTLDGNAGTWFKKLQPGSILNFAQLKYLFLINFMQLRKHHNPGHTDFREGNRHYGQTRRPPTRFRPFVRDDRRGRRPEVYTVSEKQQSAKSPKNRYCEYHKSKTHDTVNCSVLKKEMEEKQLKGDLVEIARSLRAKFDAENAKSTPREGTQPKEIFMIQTGGSTVNHAWDHEVQYPNGRGYGAGHSTQRIAMLYSYEASRNNQGDQEAQKRPRKWKEVINERYLDHPVSIRCDLPSHTRRVLVDLLKQYKHVFTWTPMDMGYHQTLMNKEDEEKTTFYTDDRTFCYTKIPFGLKNAGATYQRPVDSIFAKQIGRNIEVYVDDMVIKSPHEDKMLQDIEETFRTLEAVKMKLIPAKCTFGIEEGQFLGDAQGLNGKLTALSRFILKSANKAMPLLLTLKGCIEKSNFQWTDEAEKVLQRIKEALHELPTLADPIPGETLQVYLSTSGEAISSVLTVEREGEQKLILLKLETSGRLSKWAIELGEHDINYRPRTSIKGQALADFLLENSDGRDPTKEKVWAVEEAPADNISWTLYTDGASNKEGSGAGLILTSPEGEEVTYALRFDFHTSNNEEEYEVLLSGLRLAKKMGAKVITALTDLRLAANQVNGIFEVRDQRMGKYVKMVMQLVGLFERFTIKQIPRSENKRADALSKLASTCFDHLSKKVLVEVLRERSINEQQMNALSLAGTTWMTSFREYLQRGVLPDDHGEARKIRIKSAFVCNG